MIIDVRVPATSANLGPGFDVLGLALGLYNDIAYEEAEGVVVAIEGEGAGRLDTGADNVVARAARMVYEAAGRRFPGATIRCVNRIPPARGLGSSAAAWVGGLIAANAVLGSPLDRDAVLALACRAEGHPDNVAAALLGGLTVSCAAGDRVTAVSLPVSAGDWMGGPGAGDGKLDAGSAGRALRGRLPVRRRVQSPASGASARFCRVGAHRSPAPRDG